jgi:hypothetical protein
MTEKLDDEEWVYKMACFSERCFYCKHSDEINPDKICKAFPNGIPREIWKNQTSHTSPYPGDSGIQFEKRDSV